MPVPTDLVAGDPVSGPLLARGLVTVPFDGGVAVEGGRRRHVFRGAAAGVLADLLPLLDGSRDHDELRAASGLTARQLGGLLALLSDRGLLDADRPDGDAALSFSRNLDADEGLRSSGELLRRLADCRAWIVADPRTAERITVDLRGCGVGRVVLGDEPPPTEAHTRTVLVIVDDGSTSRTSAPADWAGPRAVPVLRLAAAGRTVEVGPVFLPGFTACPACLDRARDVAGWPPPVPADAVTAELLAAYASREALALLSGTTGMTDPRTLTRYHLDPVGTERFLVAAEPGCPTCAPGRPAAAPSPGEEPAHPAEVYEHSVAAYPPRLRPRADLLPVHLRALDGLQRVRPTFPSHPRVALDPRDLRLAGGFGAEPGDGSAVPDEVFLPELLRRVAGARSTEPGEPRRWAPSGGNLASVEAYLVRDDGTAGLPGTVFRYGDLAHELIAVRPDPVSVASLLSATDLPAAEPGDGTALVVMVAAVDRLAAKYRAFAHRLAHLDAGCACTQLAAVAAGQGRRVDFAARWDDRLATALSLVGESRFVTAVAAVRPAAPRSSEPKEGTTCR